MLYETPMNEVRFDAREDEMFEIVLDRREIQSLSKYEEILEKINFNIQKREIFTS